MRLETSTKQEKMKRQIQFIFLFLLIIITAFCLWAGKRAYISQQEQAQEKAATILKQSIQIEKKHFFRTGQSSLQFFRFKNTGYSLGGKGGLVSTIYINLLGSQSSTFR